MRIRTWLTGITLVGAMFVWGLPSVEATFNDRTWWVLRWLVHQARILGDQIRPIVLVLIVCTVIAWIVSWWANRQRTRITEQTARLLRMYPNQLRPRVFPGLRAPRRASISLPPGYSFKKEALDEAADAISRAWNYVYTLRHDEFRDRIILVRSSRDGLSDTSASDDEQTEFESPAHERLEKVKDKFPIRVKKVTPVGYNDQLQQPSSYDLTFETVANAALETWQNRVSSAIIGLVGHAPEGHQWQTEWFPSEDRVRLSLVEAPPEPQPLAGFVPHPPIEDYAAELGTDRLVLPYATGSVSPYLWWDIDHRSSAPHALITGPTGGGKTTAVGTLISEGSRRNIPWILFDPKRFELTQFGHHPGVIGVATDVHSCIEGITMLWEENEQRSRYRERRPWVENKDMPIFGIVIDEFFLLSFLLQQEMKRDEEVKKLDPRGKLNVLVTVIRAVGGRFCFILQRPDAAVWGGGNARSNLSMRLAMSRNDPDGDEMMFGRRGVTSHLDQSVPGRAMGSNPRGDAEECQVWYTPNLNQHPLVHNKLSDDEKELVRKLMPSRDVSTQLWTPASAWAFMRPKYSLDSMPDEGDPYALASGRSDATAHSEPERPSGELIMQDLDTAVEARTLKPKMRIAADLDGTLLPATVTDIQEDGDRIEVTLRLDSEKGERDVAYGRRDMVPLIETEMAST